MDSVELALGGIDIGDFAAIGELAALEQTALVVEALGGEELARDFRMRGGDGVDLAVGVIGGGSSSEERVAGRGY